MRTKYIKTSWGTVEVDFPCCIDREYQDAKREGKTWVYVDGHEHYLSVYYRHERTWDDHMGNTPCGYYCNVPMPDYTVRRVYMFA